MSGTMEGKRRREMAEFYWALNIFGSPVGFVGRDVDMDLSGLVYSRTLLVRVPNMSNAGPVQILLFISLFPKENLTT